MNNDTQLSRLVRSLFIMLCFAPLALRAQRLPVNMSYVVSMEDPASHLYHVILTYKNPGQAVLNFKMCAWTPGFYELIDFASAVQNFKAGDAAGKDLAWKKSSGNVWQVQSHGKHTITVSYDVKSTEPFIANLNLDENYGYMIPGGLLLYLDQELKHPLTVQVQPYHDWKQFIATGLDPLPGKPNTFYAANFDVVYDSPFLVGKLEILPTFNIGKTPLQFIGYNLGSFDHQQFVDDLQKITKSGSDIIGDVPFSHYTFLAVGIGGGGFGGIEHLNSSSLLVGTRNLFTDTDTKKRFYSFLAHEYFHLYNVKRIRPIALGPFDYSKENYTNMLWVSEGITDYYEYLIVKGAGLVSSKYVLNEYSDHIRDYENKPGHLYQSATQASRDIWAIGGRPTQRAGDVEDHTINVYSKGCALGLMLDLKIRHETKNKHSLDDVMRTIYKKYYQVRKRGFTDKEFQQECEAMAGTSLSEIFEYAATVAPVNYPKYFAYAGLSIDTVTRLLPGAYLGALVGNRDTTLIVRDVDRHSPAMQAGLQGGDKILKVNGVKMDKNAFNTALLNMKQNDQLQLTIGRDKQVQQITIMLGVKYEKSFAITPLTYQDQLQKKIYKSWLRE